MAHWLLARPHFSWCDCEAQAHQQLPDNFPHVPHRYFSTRSSGARYNTVTPNALPQSLAKITAFESNSHVGDPVLQPPPVRGSSLPFATFRSQISCDPKRLNVKATHLPSGE